MELYKKLYFTLFGKVEDSLELMESGDMGRARKTLIDALEQAEEAYLESDEDPEEEAVLCASIYRYLKMLRRLGRIDREAALYLTRGQADGIHPDSEAGKIESAPHE